jgi:hypothetical protein
MEERRNESRAEVDSAAVLTPLAAVANRLGGQIVNVSSRGVKVHLAELLTTPPRVGDVYRIVSDRDTMLCEVRYSESRKDATDIGFQILHWREMGQLNLVAKKLKATVVERTPTSQSA